MKIKCKKCNDILELKENTNSKCSCGAVMMSGNGNVIGVIGNDKDYEIIDNDKKILSHSIELDMDDFKDFKKMHRLEITHQIIGLILGILAIFVSVGAIMLVVSGLRVRNKIVELDDNTCIAVNDKYYCEVSK